jgi:hypothetical protein
VRAYYIYVGLAAQEARMMLPLKFSSAWSRSLLLSLVRTAGEQPLANAMGIETVLIEQLLESMRQ